MQALEQLHEADYLLCTVPPSPSVTAVSAFQAACFRAFTACFGAPMSDSILYPLMQSPCVNAETGGEMACS